MLEATVITHALVERVLTGVAEGRMAEIVGEGDRLGQVLVQTQGARDGACDLRHLDGVGEARAEHVAFVIDEDLGLVLESPEGRGMNDAIAIALKCPPHHRVGLVVKASATAVVGRSVGFQLMHCVAPLRKCNAVVREAHAAATGCARE